MSGIMDGLTGLVAGTDGAKEQFASGVNGFVTSLQAAIPNVIT